MKENENATVLQHDGRQLRISIETITPPDAAELLRGMAHNRPYKERKVERIAAAITHGEYLLNGQPIIIDSAGSLIDGQHRLRGCIESGMAFSTLVVRGVSPNVFTTLDLFERKLSEILVAEYGHDLNRGSITATAINVAYCIRKTHRIHSKDFPSPWAALEFYEAERKSLDQKITEASDKFANRVIPIGRLVAIWHEFTQVDLDVGYRFFMSICGLNHDTEHFDRLREVLLADLRKPAKSRLRPIVKIAMCIKAFNCVLANNFTDIKFSKRESFPVIGARGDAAEGELENVESADGKAI